MNKCSIKGCPGIYEKQTITHMVQHNGKIIIIEQVPAEVCTVCGDILLSIETVERIEKLLQYLGTPAHTAPVYKMPGNIEAAA